MERRPDKVREQAALPCGERTIQAESIAQAKAPHRKCCPGVSKKHKETSMAGIERRGREVIRDKEGSLGPDAEGLLEYKNGFGFYLRLPQWLSGKESPAKQEIQKTGIQPLCREDPLEEEMVAHSSILAWKIPWTEKPCRLQSRGSQRVGHN